MLLKILCFRFIDISNVTIVQRSLFDRALLKIFIMYFTGTLLSNAGSIQSPNTTDELSNEFLESVRIEFESYVFAWLQYGHYTLSMGFFRSDGQYFFGAPFSTVKSNFSSKRAPR